MVNAETVRGWQLDQLRKDVLILKHTLDAIPAGDTITLRDGEAGWTVLEVVCHLRDYEGIFRDRATITVEQTGQIFPNPNPDELAVERRYNEQDLWEVYQDWAARREAFLAYLGQQGEDAWSRVGAHPRRGEMTLHDQLALTAWHDVNHLEQILHIVAGGKQG